MTRTGISQAADARPGVSASRLRVEVLIVLGLSLGLSALYSIVDFVNDATQQKSLGSQSTTLNPSLDSRQIFDLLYQMLGLLSDVMPVALVLYLLAAPGVSAARRIGLAPLRPRFDAVSAILLTAVIGVPGLALYEGSRALGIDLHVATNGIGPQWYAVPVLLLSALRAGLQEEVIVIGYLTERLRELRWRPWTIVLGAALLRGSYHLYQGVGQFVGNALMGVVFGVFYQRFGRTAPLVIAHFLLDAISFIGPSVLVAIAPQLLPS